MNLFPDTNALVKLYHEEAGTEALSEFLHRHADNPEPSLIYKETQK